MKLFFGGVVAVGLLGLYLYLIRVAIQAAECAGPPSCTCLLYTSRCV